MQETLELVNRQRLEQFMDEANLTMVDKFCDVLLDLVCQYLLSIFASMFIRDVGLIFHFFVVSLPGFGIRVMLAS